MFGQETKHAGISKKSCITMANREMHSSLSHSFSREAFFSDLTSQLKQHTKPKAQNLIFFLPALSLNLLCSVSRK